MPVLNPKEFAIRAVRQCGTEKIRMETPNDAEAYWRQHIQGHPYFNPDVECFVVLLVNTRRRLIGHHLVALGSLDSVTIHARECFRAAIIGAASAVLLMHNLCAATHKLCYVDFGVMCSHCPPVLRSAHLRKESL